MNLSAIQKMNGPATLDEYTTVPETEVLETQQPQVKPPSGDRPRRILHRSGPEFYKPFHLILLVYLFFYCSRIPEMIPAVHAGLLLQPLLIIGMFMTKSTKAIWQSDIGRTMCYFTGWIAVCVPFATWKGGAFDQFMLALQALGLIFFMTAFVRTLDDVYRVMYTIAFAMAVVGVLSLVIGGGREGSTRLGLGTGNDTLSDANFLALFLIVGLPLILFSASMKRGIGKIFYVLMLFPVLAGAARTGSRSGLLAFSAGTIFFLIFASAKQRITILGGGLIFVVAAALLLPANILNRFTTFLHADSAASNEAAESANTRRVLLSKSLELTLKHPVLGVGPGEFMEGEAKEAMARGERGIWHYTHNSYTELSSECGILGLVFYVIALWKCFHGLTWIRKRFPRFSTRRAAMFVQTTVLMSAIGAFFLSIAYGGILYAIIGLSACMQLAAKREYKEMMAPAIEEAAA